MDTNYIQLCAEMAYNEEIMNSYLCEISEEQLDSFGEKVKKFFINILKVIRNIADKVSAFLTEKINKLEEYIDEFYDIIDDEDENNEFEESYIEPIGDISINEGFDYDDALSRFYQICVQDGIINKEEKIRVIHSQYIEKLSSIYTKYMQMNIDKKDTFETARGLMYRTSNEFNDQTKLISIYTNFDKELKSIFSKVYTNNDIHKFPSDAFLQMCKDINKTHQKEIEMSIRFIEQDSKRCEQYWRANKDNDNDNRTDLLVIYNRAMMDICNSMVRKLNEIHGAYAKATAAIVANFTSATVAAKKNAKAS